MKDAEIDGFMKMKVLVDVDVAIAHGVCDDLGWVEEIKEAAIGGSQMQNNLLLLYLRGV